MRQSCQLSHRCCHRLLSERKFQHGHGNRLRSRLTARSTSAQSLEKDGTIENQYPQGQFIVFDFVKFKLDPFNSNPIWVTFRRPNSNLQSIGNPSNNFQNYREMFKLTKRKMAISIPYISLLSKDIFNKTTSPKEQLDDILSRSILITKLMKEIRTSQTIIDSATLDATILKKIYSLTVRNDDGKTLILFLVTKFLSDLYYLSYKLDTPQSQYEKEDLKRLKSMRKAKSQLKL